MRGIINRICRKSLVAQWRGGRLCGDLVILIAAYGISVPSGTVMSFSPFVCLIVLVELSRVVQRAMFLESRYKHP
jgi:hypothetical protein